MFIPMLGSDGTETLVKMPFLLFQSLQLIEMNIETALHKQNLVRNC